MLTQPQTRHADSGTSPSRRRCWCSPTAPCSKAFGFGATGHAVGEVCFNTAMTGYQEILTDPSYAGQIITFTFPHIGNVGTNEEDIETVNLAATPGARGVVLHSAITAPSNYRATRHLDQWLKSRGVIGLAGIDTRALTALIREKGMPNARDRARAVRPLRSRRAASARRGMAGPRRHGSRADGDDRRSASPGTRRRGIGARATANRRDPEFHVVAIDYGIKRNILRQLAGNRLQGDGGAGDRPRPPTFWRSSPTAFSSPTARAIRRRPANMRCR